MEKKNGKNFHWNKIIVLLLTLFSFIGLWDSWYLTSLHYSGFLPPCHAAFSFIDCGEVLRSSYAVVFGIPLALFGIVHYSIMSILSFLGIFRSHKIIRILSIIESTGGALASLYFVYLMVFIIGKICTYCTLSAFTSFLLFGISIVYFKKERIELVVWVMELVYRIFLKPIFFRIDPEIVHESMVSMGHIFGTIPLARSAFTFGLNYNDVRLNQTIAGILFPNPIGLSAGFDYDAKLTQILPSLGFGFMSIGTVTHLSYEGNPKPRLGRLPYSQALMVNKGFKGIGAEAIRKKLEGLLFAIPVGISIGRSNSPTLKNQTQSIDDILTSFDTFEKSSVLHSYYELNISCPNLIHGNISFYPPENLFELLLELKKLKVQKPIFIKMPIEISNQEFLNMMKVIEKFDIHGVIIGNLQKNHRDPSLDPKEVALFDRGHFSGKATWNRSNELISLVHKTYNNRFVIIGCGGVFSPNDAEEKIRLGASLIQLITGMIFQGPQLISSINLSLSSDIQKYNLPSIKEFVHQKQHEVTL
jgi:dihydroorotate dehydrogenase